MSKYIGELCPCDPYYMSREFYKEEESGIYYHNDCDLPRNLTTVMVPGVEASLIEWSYKCDGCDTWFSTSDVWEPNDDKYCSECLAEMGMD